MPYYLALENKSAEEFVAGLESRVFGYFSLPLILQSDNGTEFKNSLMIKLIESWDGECKIIHLNSSQNNCLKLYFG